MLPNTIDVHTYTYLTANGIHLAIGLPEMTQDQIIALMAHPNSAYRHIMAPYAKQVNNNVGVAACCEAERIANDEIALIRNNPSFEYADMHVKHALVTAVDNFNALNEELSTLIREHEKNEQAVLSLVDKINEWNNLQREHAGDISKLLKLHGLQPQAKVDSTMLEDVDSNDTNEYITNYSEFEELIFKRHNNHQYNSAEELYESTLPMILDVTGQKKLKKTANTALQTQLLTINTVNNAKLGEFILPSLALTKQKLEKYYPKMVDVIYSLRDIKSKLGQSEGQKEEHTLPDFPYKAKKIKH